MQRKHDTDRHTEKKRLPGIHWLVASGILLVIAGSLAVIYYIVYEIENNAAQNARVLELSAHIEDEAQLVSEHMLPAFKALHSLDVAMSRHLAEFELYVLDVDRGPEPLSSSLSRLQAALDEFPQGGHAAVGVDRALLEETVGVFTDIAEEAFEVSSPNQLLQLLSDSESVFADFQGQLTDTRAGLDSAVLQLGAAISQDLRSARENLSLQHSLLARLEHTSIGILTLLLLFLLTVSTQLFRLLNRRLGAVAGYARAVASGQYSSEIDFVSSDRIGDMAESVNHMGKRMAALVEQAQTKAESAVRAEKAALKLANFDALTELPNRQHFFAILESAIEEARRLEEKVAVAYLDLDDFKKVNDSFGHSIGDQLLCAVAERLKHSVRECDLIVQETADSPPPKLSRLGGDEFTFLIARLHDEGEAKRVARRVLDALTRPYRIGKREFSITPSLGVAVFPNDGTTVGDLLKNADMAMYQAKAFGRNNVTLYSEEIGERNRQRLGLERDLARALECKELTVHYQPKVDLQTQGIVGAEALLRWHHPQRGSVSPADFIPLAEESGLIVPIGHWVLQQVCMQLARWQMQDFDPVPIAVNISARQLACGDLVATVRHCLQASGISSDCIQLELTESVLMNDTGVAVHTLNQLEAMGVHTSLDDFGTGYSSLSYLKRFHLRTLKIDRSFVHDIETDKDDATIVKAIIGLADSLGLEVVAEGVETEQQMEFLRSHGCKMAQGFLFSRPLPASSFEELLAAGRAESVA